MQTNLSPEELQRVLDQVNGNAAPRTMSAQQIMLAGQKKSVSTAFLLAFFFGPLGLLYATPIGGIAMIIVAVVVGGATMGVGLFFVWVACMIWAWAAVTAMNDRIDMALRAPQ